MAVIDQHGDVGTVRDDAKGRGVIYKLQTKKSPRVGGQSSNTYILRSNLKVYLSNPVFLKMNRTIIAVNNTIEAHFSITNFFLRCTGKFFKSSRLA